MKSERGGSFQQRGPSPKEIAEKTLAERRDMVNLPKRVHITDVDIPFGSLAVLMVKIVVAAIPATIMIAVIYTFLFFLLAACGVAALGS